MHRILFIIIGVFTLIIPTIVSASPTIKDCTEKADDGVADSKDIKAVMWNINDDWSNFESAVEWSSGRNVTSRLHNDFANGKVTCQYSPSTFEICGLLGGSSQSVPGVAFLCGDFIEDMHNEIQKDRRACYAAILTKTLAQSDLRSLSYAEDIAESAFDYWEERFGSDINYEACEIY